jgi:hypothetical protein
MLTFLGTMVQLQPRGQPQTSSPSAPPAAQGVGFVGKSWRWRWRYVFLTRGRSWWYIDITYIYYRDIDTICIVICIYAYIYIHSWFFCRIPEISELLQSLDLVSFKVICSSSEFKGRASGKICQIWGPWDCSVVLFCQANTNWCPNEFRRFLALDRKPGFCDHGRKYFSIFCTAAGNVTIFAGWIHHCSLRTISWDGPF